MVSETDAELAFAPKLGIGWSCSRARTASFIPPIPRSLLALSLSLTHSLTHSLTVSRLLTEVFLQAQAGAARNFSEPLLCVCVNSLSSRPPLWILLAWTTALSLLGSEAVDLRVRVRSWTREEQWTDKETGSPAGSPD